MPFYPIAPLISSFLSSFLAALLLVRTVHLHGSISLDGVSGVQKVHHEPTPRVGGLAIAAGLLVGLWLAQSERMALYWPLLVAGTPALILGLIEDVTREVGVRTRLLATMVCGVIGWFITGYSITHASTPGLDWLLHYTFISVLFTAFAVAGIANAINIVDGLNGMAGGAIAIILLSFALIATSFGDMHLARLCIGMVTVVLGFFFVNWPFGKLFLGDGGAYFMGFSIGWLAVLMLTRHPQLSAWALVLVCGHPICEVLFSVWRRYKRKRSPGDADRLHLHSLMLRRVVRRLLPHARRWVRNSVAGSVMWLVTLLPAVLGVMWPTQTPALLACLVLCGYLYVRVYRKIVRFGLRFKPLLGCRSAPHLPV